MKINNKYLYLPLVALFLTTCSQSGTGMFYSLEHEKVIEETNNLNNKAIFSTMIDTGSYYIGNVGPKIYYRSNALHFSSWRELPMPSGFARDAASSSLVMVGTDLYISRSSIDGPNKSGFYRLNEVNTNTNISSGAWIEIHSKTGSETSFTVFELHSANTNLYVNEMTRDKDGKTTSSSLYTTNDPQNAAYTAYTDISAALGITTADEIVEIAFDTTNYWAIINNSTNGEVYRDTNANFSTKTSQTANTSGKFIDFYAIDPNNVLLSNSNGKIFNTLVGDDASAAVVTWVSTGSLKTQYNGFADISTITADTMLVGTVATGTTDGVGYHQIDINTGVLNTNTSKINFSEINNYNSSNLSESTINGFLVDEINSRIFAYTENEGVFLNIDNSGREWFHE